MLYTLQVFKTISSLRIDVVKLVAVGYVKTFAPTHLIFCVQVYIVVMINHCDLFCFLILPHKLDLYAIAASFTSSDETLLWSIVCSLIRVCSLAFFVDSFPHLVVSLSGQVTGVSFLAHLVGPLAVFVRSFLLYSGPSLYRFAHFAQKRAAVIQDVITIKLTLVSWEHCQQQVHLLVCLSHVDPQMNSMIDWFIITCIYRLILHAAVTHAIMKLSRSSVQDSFRWFLLLLPDTLGFMIIGVGHNIVRNYRHNKAVRYMVRHSWTLLNSLNLKCSL